ncbi:ribosomal protein S6 kinase beta-like [Aphis craccivora]|uniref:Ribosomal protein S6 kinase beta-like n=1 Tax=Aphis craccivora TaxID=307492 RepID=A0A6G0Z0V1_APHCR|nr:ribosomal protein S6 kinase beta-like [Aphis craccivora]
MLTRSGHGKLADWWSIGALMFDMLTGTPLFKADSMDSTEDTIENILTRNLEIPLYVSIEASDILNKLLERQVSYRLGSSLNEDEEIKKHCFFNKLTEKI